MKFSVLLFTLVVSLFVSNTYAIDVAYDGYLRTRGNYFYNLDLNRDQTPNTRAYTDLRFRLNPTFLITDKLRVKTSLNFLDGVLGDNPARSGTYNNPANAYNRLIDPNSSDTSSIVGRPISSVSTSSTGGIYLADGQVESADFTPLQLRRAWAEYDIPYGTIKIGRMPFHLGMGIYANAGDGADQEAGSTRDRLLFDTAFGSYFVRPGIGWLTEGALDRSNDDFMEYFFHFGRKAETQEIAIYLAYNNQSNYLAPATVTTGPLSGRGTHYWSFDFYVQNQFDAVNVMTEVTLLSGRTVGLSLMALNAAARAEWNFKPASLLTEVGYSSGTDSDDALAGDIKTLAFNRDYNVGLILFEEAIPGGKGVMNSAGTFDTTTPTAPHSGAISNAVYGRLKWGYEVSSFFRPEINILAPVAAKNPVGGRGRFYGVEYDLITNWPIGEYMVADVSFAHFIPGDFYNSTSNGKGHSVFLMRGGLTAKF